MLKQLIVFWLWVEFYNIVYTFPEIIFRNHMSLENEAMLRKSMSDERKWGETLETYLKF